MPSRPALAHRTAFVAAAPCVGKAQKPQLI